MSIPKQPSETYFHCSKVTCLRTQVSHVRSVGLKKSSTYHTAQGKVNSKTSLVVLLHGW